MTAGFIFKIKVNTSGLFIEQVTPEGNWQHRSFLGVVSCVSFRQNPDK